MKVFSAYKYKMDMRKLSIKIDENGWWRNCDGLTEEEMDKRNFITFDEWMRESRKRK